MTHKVYTTIRPIKKPYILRPKQNHKPQAQPAVRIIKPRIIKPLPHRRGAI